MRFRHRLCFQVVHFKTTFTDKCIFFFFYTFLIQYKLKVLAHWVHVFQFVPIKMHAMDAKTQKIEPDPKNFYDGRKFWRQCVNVIDTTWGRIYLLTFENLWLSVQWPLVIKKKKIPSNYFYPHNNLRGKLNWKMNMILLVFSFNKSSTQAAWTPQVCVKSDDLDVIQHDLSKLIQWMQHLTLRSKGVHAVSVINLQTLLFLLFK